MCSKKKYDKLWKAKKALCAIIHKSYKRPDRQELSIYKCDECGYFHLTSKACDYIPTSIRDKNYFDIQKEKWGNFLQKYSYKKAQFK